MQLVQVWWLLFCVHIIYPLQWRKFVNIAKHNDKNVHIFYKDFRLRVDLTYMENDSYIGFFVVVFYQMLFYFFKLFLG